jgi:hypothetical protein
VIEDRLVVVLARDDDDLVPDARVDDSLVVDLGSAGLLGCVEPRRGRGYA